MPGLLKQSAVCPKCGVGVEAVVRTTNMEGVTVECFHEKPVFGRRKLRCKLRVSHAENDAFMKRMEVHSRRRANG